MSKGRQERARESGRCVNALYVSSYAQAGRIIIVVLSCLCVLRGECRFFVRRARDLTTFFTANVLYCDSRKSFVPDL